MSDTQFQLEPVRTGKEKITPKILFFFKRKKEKKSPLKFNLIKKKKEKKKRDKPGMWQQEMVLGMLHLVSLK
jgi:hypothetical protein